MEKKHKYSTGSLYDDYRIKPLHIMLPKMSAYGRDNDGRTKWIYFLFKDDDILSNTICDKISTDAKIELYTIKHLPKQNFMLMKPQIYTIKKFLKQNLVLTV